MDHGALGTTVIGLDAVRRAEHLGDDPPLTHRPRAARGRGFRVALAGALRGLADRVEPRRRSPSPNRA